MLAILQPDTFNESLNQIQRYEVELGQNQSATQGTRPFMGYPMDIDQIKMIGSNTSGTKPKGACFRCRKEGHWVKDCYVKQISGTSQSTQKQSFQFRGQNKFRGQGSYQGNNYRG